MTLLYSSAVRLTRPVVRAARGSIAGRSGVDKVLDMKAYQARPSHIADSAWRRGYLKPLELLRIAAWKTGQGLGLLTLNTQEDIEGRTRAAVDCIRPWKGQRVAGLTDKARWDDWRETARCAIGVEATHEGLLGLKGVGYPMASAILDILDPEVWPVIDRWAVRTVFGTQPGGAPWRPAQWQCAAAYEAYARHLATIGAACWDPGYSIHQLDIEAMRASKPGGELPPRWTLAALPPRT